MKGTLEKTLELNPDVILMNISLPDGNGLDLIKEILYRKPETKIVILSEREEEYCFLTAMRNGAKGFLQKNIPVSKLVKSLQALSDGQVAISRKMTKELVDEVQRVGKVRRTDNIKKGILTFREIEVLKCLGDGSSNKEIAAHLSISENTVRVHVSNILKKLNLRNRREVYHFLRRQNDFDLPTR